MKKALFLLACFYFFQNISFCQDTTSIVIKKSVYIVEERAHNFYLFTGASFSINKDYYNVCPNGDCQTYFNNLRGTTKNLWNNSYTAGLAYAPRKFYSEISLSYTRYREEFNYTDRNNNSFNTTNHYDYWDLGLMAGYRIKKWWSLPSHKKRKWRNNTSYILLGGIVLNKTISIEGNTLSKLYPGHVVPLGTELSFYDYNYRLQVDARIMHRLKDNVHFVSGIFYSYDLRSIIKTSELYVRQRHIIGINLILMYNL